LPPATFILQRDGTPNDLDNIGQLVETVRRLARSIVQVKRFKGLGEMNPEELATTTMDPEHRGLLKVVISSETDDPEQLELDAREADRIFSILMGDNVEARREFIETNAVNVKNLDI
jgi:DNA gyrase subunit B